jgi:catechol 2,3-dioxygenase-like lactoylglutathione lyase family enzyme
MPDHIFLTVADLERSIAFYEKTLAPLGIEHAIDYDGKDGPEGHPDLNGFGPTTVCFSGCARGPGTSSSCWIRRPQ